MAIELNQIWDFPIKEFHPFPRALMGVGAHDILGVEGSVAARNHVGGTAPVQVAAQVERWTARLR